MKCKRIFFLLKIADLSIYLKIKGKNCGNKVIIIFA